MGRLSKIPLAFFLDMLWCPRNCRVRPIITIEGNRKAEVGRVAVVVLMSPVSAVPSVTSSPVVIL